MHTLLFERQQALGTKDLIRYAEELTLYVERFRHELKNETHSERVRRLLTTSRRRIEKQRACGAEPHQNAVKDFSRRLVGSGSTDWQYARARRFIMAVHK